MIQIRIALILAMLAATNYATWYLTRQNGQNRLYEVQLAMASAANAELAARQELADKRLELINQSQVKHDKDQALINLLADNLRRVQVKGICAGSVPPDSAAANQNAGAWTFSEGVDSNFARLQFRASEQFRQCDQINIDAIRVNGQGIGIEPMK